MTTRKLTQNERILALLATGEKSTHEILREVPCIVHSRIAELRTRGYVIACRREGENYLYTLASSPQPEPEKTVASSAEPLTPSGSGSEDNREQLALDIAA